MILREGGAQAQDGFYALIVGETRTLDACQELLAIVARSWRSVMRESLSRLYGSRVTSNPVNQPGEGDTTERRNLTLRETLPGYFPPDRSERERMLAEGLVCVDTN